MIYLPSPYHSTIHQSRMLRYVHRGFTLLELIITLVVLAILAAVAIPTYESVIQSADNANTRETAKAVSLNVMAQASLARSTGEISVRGNIDYLNTAVSELDHPVTVTPSAAYSDPGPTGGCFTVTAEDSTAHVVIPVSFGDAPTPPASGPCPA